MSDSPVLPVPPVSGERLRLLTLNIWNRQGPWERRLPLLRAGIAAHAPDVVGLQEVLHHDSLGPDQAEQIADGLGYHVVYGAAWEIGGGLHFGNAVLSRWPVAAWQVFSLPLSPPLPDGTLDERRCLLHARIEAPFGALPVFVTHLNWKLHHSATRCRQVAFIAERIDELAPAGAPDRFPAVLLGDFNAEPDSDEIRFLSGFHPLDGKSVHFADCHRFVGQGNGATFCRHNPYAAQAREPDRRIDYVFVRGPDRDGRGEPLLCRLALDQPTEGTWPTDHFGVLAEVAVVPRPLPPIQ